MKGDIRGGVDDEHEWFVVGHGLDGWNVEEGKQEQQCKTKVRSEKANVESSRRRSSFDYAYIFLVVMNQKKKRNRIYKNPAERDSIGSLRRLFTSN